MKKLTLLLLSFTVCLLAGAQTPSDSIKEAYGKIANLENRLSLQDSKINKLMQQVDEVTRQNLALKKNLKLSPTIATAKAGEIMEYRIIEVTGDSTTVHMTMIADNISGVDKSLMYWSYRVIDDQGHGFENSNTNDRFRLKVNGESDSIMRHTLNHPKNAPYTIDVYLYGCNPDVQFIKYFDLEVTEGMKHYNVVFENLPIMWKHRKSR